MTLLHRPLAYLAIALPLALAASGHAATTELKDLSINGGLEDGKARLVIEAQLKGLTGADRERLLFATALQHLIHVGRDNLRHTIHATFDILQGEPKELPLTLNGPGEITKVTGDNLQDWSVRQESGGARTLVLRPRKTDKPLTQLSVVITAEREEKTWSNPVTPLTLTPAQPSLGNGFVKIEFEPELEVRAVEPSGMVPIEPKFLPEPLRRELKSDEPEPLAFRFHGSAYSLPLRVSVADPETRRIVLRDFKLQGQMGPDSARFVLTAVAQVKNPKGGRLNLLSGNVALNELQAHPDWRLTFDQGQFVLITERAGEFPLQLEFNALVRASGGWNAVDFRLAPSTLQPVTLRGLAADTQFRFTGAARPDRRGDDFVSYLPSDGRVQLSWKEARVEMEGKLFYSAEMLAQVSISPGLMRQIAVLDGKVMQGELTRLSLELRGPGNVTRVQGPDVLSWSVEPGTDGTRRLNVQFNQPQKDQFQIQVQAQTELGAFPQAVEALQLRPDGATRFAGHLRVVNEGAVRLEVIESGGLSQISPEQFPETDSTKMLFSSRATQRFAFRFAGAAVHLRVQADNVLPELGVSELLAYHLGETELAIEAELELDIREAPARELLLRVPKGYAIARLNASGLNDYFLTEDANDANAQLRLVFGQPIIGRQVLQLRLERNAALGLPVWNLPRIELTTAKSTRGHLAISSEPGFRLSAERTVALTEIATAFFPKKLAGLQAAFRMSEPAWDASVRVERLPQTVQADVLHLFSIGEGIAYGSSTINYGISGAPVATFRIELSPEYFNVEFLGKDVRHWQKSTNGYVVQLHTPVAGAYTLLVSYERPFKAQGETLTFTGARPLDALTEQGHTLVVSAYQFKVEPVNVSAGLLPLETAEVPSEYRLLFDTPILKAYRYASRPFNLQLALSPLTQGKTLSLVVDRAAITTRISKDGEAVTDARYFVKNRGHTHFSLVVPADAKLWSATVNGVTAVPVKDGEANLIPLPSHTDPNTVQTLEVKLASRSKTPERVAIAAPVIEAPVLLSEWKVQADAGRRLIYRKGALVPAAGVPDDSGFAALANLFRHDSPKAVAQLLLALALLGLALTAWRWSGREGTWKNSFRHLAGAGLGIAAMALAFIVLANLGALAAQQQPPPPRDLEFLAPVQQGRSVLHLEVANLDLHPAFWARAGALWPAALAFLIWGCVWLGFQPALRRLGLLVGWTFLAWGALRSPQGAPIFFLVLMSFLVVHLVLPLLRRLWQLPLKPSAPPASSPSPATATILMLALLLAGAGHLSAAPAGGRGTNTAATSARQEQPVAESVLQTIRVEESFGLAQVKLRWRAQRGQILPVLDAPAVLTRIVYPTDALKLSQTVANSRRTHQLLAEKEGVFDLEMEIQLPVTEKNGERGFALPTRQGLVNRVQLTLVGLDVEIAAPEAVLVERETAGTNTVARLVLPPAKDAWVGWKPRSRDVKREKAVFYAEMFQLYAPAPGVIEGAHFAQIRPAQGEVSELTFDVPVGLTISDVTEHSPAPAQTKAGQNAEPARSLVSVWRFDPDSRKLRVTLSPPPSRSFTLLVRSQLSSGPLPFEQRIGLLQLNQAAAQVGALGVATGPEVQLDQVTADNFTAINLEDFPGSALQPLAAQIPGLTLRRAFRYADPKLTASVKASPVQPDVRVETQQTLSLGEDRTLLAVNVNAAIARAGIFRLSFPLPAGFEVESISGPALSHWTELRTAEGRIVTLHLKGKTEGQTQFALSLAAPGVKATNSWTVARFVMREAGKQSGQLAIVPEQGLRPQVVTREGLTQLDPQKAGIRQKGVLAFRLLQDQWNLVLDLQQVDPWVQVTSLQHTTVTEAQLKTAINFQYQIENTGLKSLRIRIPTNAESVRFRGEQVADFLPVPGPSQDGLQTWEIKLHRRVLGRYLLQATFQTLLSEQATNVLLRGVQAADVNLQRGFVTLESGGRLQIRAETPPPALQATEWQSIPRALRQDIASVSANYAFRLVEPAFQLPVQLERHQAAQLQPARVTSATLTSVVSDDGVMLTEVRLEMVPGDLRLLKLGLPASAEFWFAFVNQNGVWPWRDPDGILIPLEQQSRPDKPTVVEFYYSSTNGGPGRHGLDLKLLGPKLDLPLENLAWRVYLNDKWHLTDWRGSLELQEDREVGPAIQADLQGYLRSEALLNQEKTKEAEQLLAMGNSLLQKGDPQQARRAFQSAYGLSAHDNAFNEDARVQLHNLKVQQALVGLNVRQAASGAEADNAPGKLGDLRGRKNATYTQEEAKQILESNSAEDNAAFTRLAERLIQQQDAAVTAPAAIRASIPQQGRLLTFRRAVQVDTWTNLNVELKATATRGASSGTRFFALAVTFAFLAALGWARRAVVAGQ
jgi:hypothetical protein